jgi:hypothetical protein
LPASLWCEPGSFDASVHRIGSKSSSIAAVVTQQLRLTDRQSIEAVAGAEGPLAAEAVSRLKILSMIDPKMLI